MTIPVIASRSLAVLILVGVLIALQLTVGQPVLDSFFARRESIAQSQELLAKYRKLNDSRRQVNTNLQRLKAMQAADEGRLLVGESTQLVGAQLQNRMKELIEAHHATLGSMQLLPVRQEDNFQRISMAVALTATTESLKEIIYEIENQTPYFFIEKIELRKEDRFMSLANSRNPGELQVRLEFYGYMPPETQ